LAAVAFGLFAARYLVTRTLSFETSLIPVHILPVFERLETHLSAITKSPGDPKSGERTQRADEFGGQLPNQKPNENTAAKAQELAGTTNSDNNSSPKPNTGSEANAKSQQSENQNGSANSGNTDHDGKQADQLAGSEKTPQGADGKQQPSTGQQGSQGLMDKMKDAFSSLVAKMRENAGQQAQQNSRQSNEDKAASQSSSKAQPSDQQDARNQQPSQDQASEGQSQAQATEKPQSSQGRSSDSLPEKGADAHSGIGRQDGDKAVKEAEQLQAMGKLAEIIGKRSASLTGDMTVETPSGKQQLKTAYSQKLGRHTDAGGEINRDEIPLSDQQYVREYMELIHKQNKSGK
jgi:hypothetical protein